MLHNRRFPLSYNFFFLSLLCVAGGSVVAGTGQSYEQARDRYLQQQKQKAKQPKFSSQDRTVMQQAAEKLKQRLPKPGLKPGAQAPDFVLPNAAGSPVSLREKLKSGPVVLVFYRGAWCPFCNLHLHTLQQHLPEFRDYGAQLLAITPQRPDKSQLQIKKDKLSFEVLSDLDDSVMQAYQLYYKLDPELVQVYIRHGLDVAEYNGPGRTVLPVPGTFIIDTQGIIRAAHADTDYKQRMEPQAIIRVLHQLAAER